MKLFIGILITALGAAAATYSFVRPHLARQAAATRAELMAKHEAERKSLEAELVEALAAASRQGDASGMVSTGPTGPSVTELVEKLKITRVPVGPTRITVQRGIILDMGEIAKFGDGAVQDIRGYLLLFEDVNYGSEASAEGNPEAQNSGPGGGRPPWADAARDFLGRGRDQAPLDFPFPPSLRIALMDVLQMIRTPNAESALMEVLQSTARGLEIAYVTRLLEDVAPGKYRAQAVAAAHELLLNPVAVEGGPRAEAQHQAYLYKVLEFYRDTSFAQIAQGLLTDPDGRLNRNAFDYLTRTMGKEALPALYEAFNSPGLTNFMDRATVMNSALAFVGQDDYANAMFSSVLTNETIPGRIREMTVMSLNPNQAPWGGRGGRGGGGDREPVELDPTIVQQQIDFLAQMHQSTQDRDIARSIERVTRDLSSQVEGVVAPNLGDGGGDDGGRGRRRGGDGGR
jgi:hypothetical protein